MNRFLLVLAFSLLILGIPNVHARNSAASYDNKYYSQQEFVQAYNNSTATIYRDYVVGLDVNSSGINNGATPGINPNNNLGQYVTEVTGSTTDSIYVFGVSDETIPAGQLGRICIRGAHKVNYISTAAPLAAPTTTVGTAVSQCKNNVAMINTQNATTGPINGGVACPYSTATGTAGGMIGYILSSTATTDTGDSGQSTSVSSNTTGSEYWIWVDPQVLR